MYNLRNRPTGSISLGRGIIRSPNTMASIGRPMSPTTMASLSIPRSGAAQFSQSAGEPSTSYANPNTINPFGSPVSFPNYFDETEKTMNNGTLEGDHENKDESRNPSVIINRPSIHVGGRDASMHLSDNLSLPMQSLSDTALVNTTAQKTNKPETSDVKDHEINSLRDELKKCHEMIQKLQEQQPSITVSNTSSTQPNSQCSIVVSQPNTSQPCTMRDWQIMNASSDIHGSLPNSLSQVPQTSTQFSSRSLQSQHNNFVDSHIMQPRSQQYDTQFAHPTCSTSYSTVPALQSPNSQYCRTLPLQPQGLITSPQPNYYPQSGAYTSETQLTGNAFQPSLQQLSTQISYPGFRQLSNNNIHMDATRTSDNGRRNRVPYYSGKEPWSAYVMQFNLIADSNNWSLETRAIELLTAMKDEAMVYASYLPTEVKQNFPALCMVMANRYGDHGYPETYRQELHSLRKHHKETIHEYASRVEMLVRKSFPTMDASTHSTLSVEYMLRGLPDQSIALDLLTKRLTSMTEAIHQVTLVETYKRGMRNNIRQLCIDDQDHAYPESDVDTVEVRKVGNKRFVTEERLSQFERDIKDSISKSVGDAVESKLRKFNNGNGNNNRPNQYFRRDNKDKNKCFNCGEVGHFKKDCKNERRDQTQNRRNTSTNQNKNDESLN